MTVKQIRVSRTTTEYVRLNSAELADVLGLEEEYVDAHLADGSLVQYLEDHLQDDWDGEFFRGANVGLEQLSVTETT